MSNKLHGFTSQNRVCLVYVIKTPYLCLFSDDSIIYRIITNKNDIEKLQKALDTLGEWAVENGMKINHSKNKAIRFTTAGVKNPLSYSLGAQKILEASSCTHLGIILRSDLNWMDQVNDAGQKAWKALHVGMRVLKKGNRNTESLAYTSLVRPILYAGIHARTDKCVRPSTEESCLIYKSYGRF
jgi:hypothetical protein